MIQETVYQDADNEIKIQVLADGVPVPFLDGGAYLVEVHFDVLVIDSNTDSVIYDNEGNIVLKLGDAQVKKINRKLPTKIKVFDPSHPNGQWVVHPRMVNSSLVLTFVD